MHNHKLALAALVPFCTAYIGLNDKVNAPIDYGTFSDPSTNVRPRFRYWLPDASGNLSIIQSDVAGAASVGAGGLEFLGYFMYGGTNAFGQGGAAQSDWSVYGWGTPAWSKLLGLLHIGVFMS